MRMDLQLMFHLHLNVSSKLYYVQPQCSILLHTVEYFKSFELMELRVSFIAI